MKNKNAGYLHRFLGTLIVPVCVAASLSVHALAQAASAQAPASWGKGIIQDGHPAVELGDPSVPGALTMSIAGLEYKGEDALRFPTFSHDSNQVVYLYLTRTTMYYDSSESPSDYVKPFNVTTASGNVTISQASDSVDNEFFLIRIGGSNSTLEMMPAWQQNNGRILKWKDYQKFDPNKEDYKRYVRNAREERGEAEKEFSSWLQLATSNFDAAQRKFQELTKDISTPPLTSENEQAGDAAEQSGKLFDALQHYQSALQALPTWAPADVEQPLRERIVKLVQRMNPPPAIPEEAERHEAYAMAALDQAKTGDYSSSIQEFNQTLQLAPWWGAAYFNYALVLEKAGRYAAASRNLHLYLLASPNAPDFQTVKMKMYSLEYKANHP